MSPVTRKLVFGVSDQMRRLICAFSVRIGQKQVFSWRGSYMDRQYYLNDNRAVNPYEITVLGHCYKYWKDNRFLVSSWKCPTKDIPQSAGLADGSRGPRSKRSTNEFTKCDCLTSKGSLSFKGTMRATLIWFCLLNILLFPQVWILSESYETEFNSEINFRILCFLDSFTFSLTLSTSLCLWHTKYKIAFIPYLAGYLIWASTCSCQTRG